MRTITNISTNPQAEIYAFSAKERDTETGLSYFGSRYYSSDLSIWLAVDPMSDKYPSLSPYVYCADNPVRCVDPNGEEATPPPFILFPAVIFGIVDALQYKHNANHNTMTISNTRQAIKHYYFGGGHKVDLDPKFAKILMNTKDFKNMHQKIISGKNKEEKGYFSVDMTNEKDAFFIGRTGVSYEITKSKDGKTNIVTYKMFEYRNGPDNFSDPDFIKENISPELADGKGPNLELHGKPYDFNPQKVQIQYEIPANKTEQK